MSEVHSFSKERETFIANLFTQLRPLQNSSEQKRFLTKKMLELDMTIQDVVRDVIQTDRTGWKEVVANISVLTCLGYQDLGLSDHIISKVTGFRHTHQTRSNPREWIEYLKEISLSASAVVMDSEPA